MKKYRGNRAVTEVVGTAILLGIAIALFSVVQTVALTFPFNPPTPSAQLVGAIDGDKIIIEHHGGESLALDTKIMFRIEGHPEIVQEAGDILDTTSSNGDEFWNIGEKVSYTPSFDISGLRIHITVVDLVSNSIVMSGSLVGDSS